MAARHVVVDGSNLATEGRSMPSLAQLDQAVREFLTENPEDVVTVVVDASFGHRIDSSESKMFEEAEDAGELVSPPAGAIGRGDAFLLRIADKTGATVLSNDSFQEFHGDYDWLFERGRLIGGKPVPGVGWIFTPRTPVRGPRSREAVKEAKRKTTKEPESAKPGLDLAAERARTKGQGKGKKNVERAIAVALEEAVAPKDKPHRRRKGGSPPADPVNDPLTFITFIAAHPLGAEVTATVDSFASHGAFVDCEGARCYVPLSAMGSPPPKSAREIFTKGQEVRFVVQALDPQRRGVELAVPGFAKIAGAPTDETVAAEIEGQADDEAEDVGARGAMASAPSAPTALAPPPARRTRKKAAPAGPDPALDPSATAAVKKAAPRRRAPRVSSGSPASPGSSGGAEGIGGAAEVGSEVEAAPPTDGTTLPVRPRPPAAVASMQAAPQQTPVPGTRTPRRRGSQVSSVPSVEGALDAAVADESTGVPARASRRRGSRVVPEGSAGAVPEATAVEAPAASVGQAPRQRRSRAVPEGAAGAVATEAEAEAQPVGPTKPTKPTKATKRQPPSSRAGGSDQQARQHPPSDTDALPAPPAEPAQPAARSKRRPSPGGPPAESVHESAPVEAPTRPRRRATSAERAAEPVEAPREPPPAPSGSNRRRAAAAPDDETAPLAGRAKRPRSPQASPGESDSAAMPPPPSPRRRRPARDRGGAGGDD